MTGRAALLGGTVYIEDTEADDSYQWQDASRKGLSAPLLAVPLIRDGVTVGVINLASFGVSAYSRKQVSLLETFAAQAVIALGNARLFDEVQQRTAEVEERWNSKGPSAEVLSVISQSVKDTQPVFEKILDSCRTLFNGDELTVTLLNDNGELELVSYLGSAHDLVYGGFPAKVENSPVGAAVTSRRVAHFADALNDPDAPKALKRIAQGAGNFSVAFAPMIWEGAAIGVIGVARTDRPFRTKEQNILRGFADQAVIAIQNSRLFRETNEALERQTATTEVLEVISNSVEDAQPVFEKILEKLSEADEMHRPVHHYYERNGRGQAAGGSWPPYRGKGRLQPVRA